MNCKGCGHSYILQRIKFRNVFARQRNLHIAREFSQSFSLNAPHQCPHLSLYAWKTIWQLKRKKS